LTLAVNLFHSI